MEFLEVEIEVILSQLFVELLFLRLARTPLGAIVPVVVVEFILNRKVGIIRTVEVGFVQSGEEGQVNIEFHILTD